MLMDKYSETIAHFIGLFSLTLEEARLREIYDEIEALRALAQENPELPNLSPDVDARYTFVGAQAGIGFYPEHEPVPLEPAYVPMHWDWPPIPERGHERFHASEGLEPKPGGPGGEAWTPGGGGTTITDGLPNAPLPGPGSIAVVIHQSNRLEDDDYVNLTSHKIAVTPTPVAAQMLTLLGARDALDPLGPMAPPANEAAIAEAAVGVREAIGTLDQHAGGPATIYVATGGETPGTHVNGELRSAAPSVDDHLPAPLQPSDESEDEDAGPMVLAPEVETGANLLVNEVALKSGWSGAPVLVVGGDSVALDVVSQTNVWSDTDDVALPGLCKAEDGPTQAFNVASFARKASTPTEGRPAAADDIVAAPHRIVTTLEGNLVTVNWLEQINFVMDNDVVVMSAAGSQTYLQVGGNVATSSISLHEIGLHYDLIAVRNDVVSLNLVRQSNVLLDDDVVHPLPGYGGSVAASFASHGNLLWNQAAIHSVGLTTYAGLGDADVAAMSGIGTGTGRLPFSPLVDDALAGMETIRVLEIAGSILNLTYVRQSNVLGDSDLVALVADSLAEDGADWSISTGANALLNIARIDEFASDATMYLGGEKYSDALLHQAELIDDDPLPEIGDPLALASEAVAFLTDDPFDARGDDDGMSIRDVAGEIPADVMATILT